MVDFIVELFAEIADFFITFWGDNVIDKFTKRKKKEVHSCFSRCTT